MAVSFELQIESRVQTYRLVLAWRFGMDNKAKVAWLSQKLPTLQSKLIEVPAFERLLAAFNGKEAS